MTSPKLTAAVEAYIKDLRAIRASGGATAELSYHTPLNNLLTAVGAALKPKVRCVGELQDMGAGHPDLGLYSTTQRSRRGGFETRPPRSRIPAELPDCGVVEIKSASDDAWLTVDSDQVSKYWNKYRLVLVTNTRDFVLLGEDRADCRLLEHARSLDVRQAAVQLDKCYNVECRHVDAVPDRGVIHLDGVHHINQ